MDLKTYTLEELASYAGSIRYGSSGTLPLSPLRLASYLHNPRAERTDHVLFEMYDGDKLVAFRTLLPDRFCDQTGHYHRFAWLSGNYVDPAFRRQGISTKLLRAAEECWEGKLLYTNYAPASRAVYDQTGRFRLLKERSGKRFYLRAASRELMAWKGVPGSLLGTADRIINQVHDRMLERFRADRESSCAVEEMGMPDPEVGLLIERLQENSLFYRDMEVFQWILRYPWVTDRNADPVPYHFSHKASLFKNRLLKFTSPGTEKPAFLWIIIHDGKLTVPYALRENPAMDRDMAVEILRTMIIRRCAYTTIREPSLVEQMTRFRKWFLLSRNMPQLVFAHEKIAGMIPGDRVMHDGDGDVVFTG